MSAFPRQTTAAQTSSMPLALTDQKALAGGIRRDTAALRHPDRFQPAPLDQTVRFHALSGLKSTYRARSALCQ
jgi:hypothetical protein